MKKAFLILSAALMLATTSCTKDSGQGGLRFSISSDVSLTDEAKSKLSDIIALPAGKDFSLVLKNSGGETIWSGLLSEWVPSTKLAVGSYAVSANYGNANDEGVAKPLFAGEKAFSIAGGENTEVKIPVELQNSIVKVSCTDAFKNYFTDYQFTLTTGIGNDFVLDKDCTDPIFIDAYKFTVKGKLTNQGGAVQNFEKTYENLEAATCYTLKFDATNVGGFKVTITFKDDVTTVDLGNLEIN